MALGPYLNDGILLGIGEVALPALALDVEAEDSERSESGVEAGTGGGVADQLIEHDVNLRKRQ